MVKYKLNLITPLVNTPEFNNFLIKMTENIGNIRSDNFFDLLNSYTKLPSYFYDLSLKKYAASPLKLIKDSKVEEWFDNSIIKGSLVFPNTFTDLEYLVNGDKKKVKIEIPDEGSILGTIVKQRELKTRYYFERDN